MPSSFLNTREARDFAREVGEIFGDYLVALFKYIKEKKGEEWEEWSRTRNYKLECVGRNVCEVVRKLFLLYDVSPVTWELRDYFGCVCSLETDTKPKEQKEIEEKYITLLQEISDDDLRGTPEDHHRYGTLNGSDMLKYAVKGIKAVLRAYMKTKLI